MEDKKIVLALDVSTKTIGISLILSENGENKIMKITHISPKVSSKLKGIEPLFLKKQIFEDEVLCEYKKYGITDVVIEEPLLGSNNINSVAILLRFNGMISESVYRTLGIVPEYISSYDARKYSTPKLLAIRKFDKKGNSYPTKKIKKAIKDNDLVLFGNYHFDISKKDVMLNIINETYTDIQWIYDSKGELKKENFDATDALVCGLGFLNRKKYGDIEPKIVNVEESDGYIYYDVEIWGNIYKQKIKIDI